MPKITINTTTRDRFLIILGWYRYDDRNGPYTMWDDTTWITAIRSIRGAKYLEDYITIMTSDCDIMSVDEVHAILGVCDNEGVIS